jgi:putative glutamine amidotransferase
LANLQEISYYNGYYERNERKIRLKPVIGVSSYIKYHAEIKKLDFDATITQQDVLNALFKANALPVIIPISDEEDIKEYVKNVDALVMQGGADVDPLLYGEEPSLLVTSIDPHRDRFEIAMIKEAWKQKKPILGICRGLQILNTAMGGTLYQDLSYYEGLKIKHSQTTPMHYPTHTVTLDEDSFLGRIMGK